MVVQEAQVLTLLARKLEMEALVLIMLCALVLMKFEVAVVEAVMPDLQDKDLVVQVVEVLKDKME